MCQSLLDHSIHSSASVGLKHVFVTWLHWLQGPWEPSGGFPKCLLGCHSGLAVAGEAAAFPEPRRSTKKWTWNIRWSSTTIKHMCVSVLSVYTVYSWWQFVVQFYYNHCEMQSEYTDVRYMFRGYCFTLETHSLSFILGVFHGGLICHVNPPLVPSCRINSRSAAALVCLLDRPDGAALECWAAWQDW